jgi:hypothetical protein
MPASETSRKTNSLKVSINICSNYWHVYVFCIVNVIGEKKIFLKALVQKRTPAAGTQYRAELTQYYG